MTRILKKAGIDDCDNDDVQLLLEAAESEPWVCLRREVGGGGVPAEAVQEGRPSAPGEGKWWTHLVLEL